MTAKKQIGIFWGKDFLSVAEEQAGKLIFVAAIPRKNPEKNEPFSTPDNVTNSENLYLTAAIQRFVRNQKITKPIACLAIPSLDIIFRSFTLPAMDQEEIENAIIFEAPRYIPFKLNDLFFTYHTVPFTEHDIRKNRILFLAIRKDTLGQYCKIFEDADIEIRSAEPSLLALLRILSAKKLTKTNRPIAVVQIAEGQGSIMIVDQQIPQFIRDFNLMAPLADTSIPDFKLLAGRIASEIRMSLDFYSRQIQKTGRENKIEQICLWGSPDIKDTVLGIKNETGIDTQFFDINGIFPYENQLHPDMANAIGAGLMEHIPISEEFNLARARRLDLKKASSKNLQGFLSRSPDYRLTTLVAVICTLIFSGLFAKIFFQVLPQEKKITDLKISDQKYQNASTDVLRQSAADLAKKIDAYRDVRFKSIVASYLENISQSLIDGVWLQDLDIKPSAPFLAVDTEASKTKKEKKEVLFSFTGYAYDEQLDRQIVLVEKFLQNLKENSFFTKYSAKIELVSVKKETMQDFSVTRFQIKMELNEIRD